MYVKGKRRKTKLYAVWVSMKQRCYNPNNINYSYYGMRGIKVHHAWLASFEIFYKWSFKKGYKEGLSLERTNNNKGYSPNNCRWATHKEQMRNVSRNKIIIYKKRAQCLSAWAEELNINRKTLIMRLNRGWTIKEAFETPIINNQKL